MNGESGARRKEFVQTFEVSDIQDFVCFNNRG
jgi:hypothetical protein